MGRRLLLVVASVLACSCASPTSPASPVSTVSIEYIATGGGYSYESALLYWAGPPTPPPQVQLRAWATLEDGRRLDVTPQTAWQASSPAIATISSTGAVTIAALGQAGFTATYHGVLGVTFVTTTADPADLDN